MSRWRPPYPPRTIRPRPCPTGVARYRTRGLALAPITSAMPISPIVTDCPHCGGAHLDPEGTR